jgi:hypothetical protein
MRRYTQYVILVIVSLSTLAFVLTLSAESGDEEGIRQAVLDYANSAYDVKPELVERSVHPKLQKVGYVHRRDAAGYRQVWMNYDELKELVSGWNKEGRFDPQTAKREVKILDKLDQTAVARLDAEWGVDFFHLGKVDGKWMIMNVIWQSYPKTKTATTVDRD